MGSLIEGYSIEDVFFKKSDKTNTLDKDLNLMFSVPLGRIKTNKEQPRKVFNEKTLNELAQSIKAQGILQPILVEEIADNMFSIVAGERRFKAAEITTLCIHMLTVLLTSFPPSVAFVTDIPTASFLLSIEPGTLC